MASTASIRPSIGRILNPYRALQTQTSQIAPLAILSAFSPTGPALTTQPQLQPPCQAQQRQQRCPFSTTAAQSMRRPRRDNNRLRGVSAIYRSGPRWRGNVRREEVPTPAAYRPAEDVEVDPDHGLWQFFYGKEKLLLTPEEDAQHGRAWIVEELRHKSWEDLHRLWWVCVKEQNRIATHRREKQNMGFQHGVEETAARLAEVRKTMKAIKHALTERFYLWEDARTLAQSDPEVDLSGEGDAYKPGGHYFTETPTGSGEDQAAAASGSEETQQTTPGDKIDPSTLPQTPGETQQPTTRQ